MSFCFGITAAYSGLNRRIFAFLFLAVSAIFIIGFTFGGIDFRSYSRFVHMNRNGISLFQLMTATMLYYSFKKTPASPVPIWPSMITLLITYLSKSRAGILLAFILIIGVLFENVRILYLGEKKVLNMFSNRKFLMLLMLFFIFIAVGIFAYRTSRLSTVGFSSEGRLEIYKVYFQNMTITKFILGFNIDTLQLRFQGLHNSYLRLLSYVGIASLPVFGAVGSTFFVLRKQPFLVILLGIFCLYSFVEYRLFIDLADLILFPPLFLAVREARRRQKPVNNE
jgi:hypothetical protein